MLAGGQRLRYDCLLLATGALAVQPPFAKEPLAGLVKIDSLDDTRLILKSARRGHSAVVVGGGITALELAEGLCARRMHVHYFLRGNRYWADVLDEAESHIVLERLRHEGVVIHLNTQVKQVHGTGGPTDGRRNRVWRDGAVSDAGLCHRRAPARGSGTQRRLESR